MDQQIVDQLNAEIESFNEEYEKFKEKGNSSAGTRARKHLQEVKRLAQDARKDIQEAKKG